MKLLGIGLICFFKETLWYYFISVACNLGEWYSSNKLEADFRVIKIDVLMPRELGKARGSKIANLKSGGTKIKQSRQETDEQDGRWHVTQGKLAWSPEHEKPTGILVLHKRSRYGSRAWVLTVGHQSWYFLHSIDETSYFIIVYPRLECDSVIYVPNQLHTRWGVTNYHFGIEICVLQARRHIVPHSIDISVRCWLGNPHPVIESLSFNQPRSNRNASSELPSCKFSSCFFDSILHRSPELQPLPEADL